MKHILDAHPQKAVSQVKGCAVKVPRAMQSPLNATFADQFKTPCLVEIIRLKWLLAGHGVRVHVEQIQTDREYALRTLDHADAVPNAALREAAAELRKCMCLCDQ
jgi:hypothetical protein